MSNPSVQELLPCPCGNKNLEFEEGFLDDVCSLSCAKCGRTTGECESREDAVRSWNSLSSEEFGDVPG